VGANDIGKTGGGSTNRMRKGRASMELKIQQTRVFRYFRERFYKDIAGVETGGGWEGQKKSYQKRTQEGTEGRKRRLVWSKF